MRPFICVLMFWAGFLSASHAQVAASDSVKAVVLAFFQGMSNADSAAIRATLAPEVVFQSVARRKSGETVVATENVERFLGSVAQAKKGQLDERITFGSVLVDGPLAVVWTPYSFFYDGKFSHCGVNSFQVVRLMSGWKIQYIIDTRRKEGCQ